MGKNAGQSAARCFEQLGLPLGASQEEIRSAYLRLIRVWHPDVHSGDPRRAEETSKELNAAFRALKTLSPEQLTRLRHQPPTSPERRAPKRRRQAARPKRSRAEARGGQVVLRRASRTVSKRRGRDIVAVVDITPEETSFGACWQFAVPTCSACAGWGVAWGEQFHVCQGCRGLGILGLSAGGNLRPCSFCSGRGCFFDRACGCCEGSGESTQFIARCRVAPGIDRGFLGVLEGVGHPGARGGLAGDLYLTVADQSLASRWLCHGVQ